MLSLHKKKRIVLSVFVAVVVLLPAAIFAANRLVNINNTFAVSDAATQAGFDDDNFYKCALNALGITDTTTVLSDTQLASITQISCGYGSASDVPEGATIYSVTGIEKMTGLQNLYIGHNAVTTLDLSHNPEIVGVYAFSNGMTSINLSQNTKLEKLNLNGNNLTSLDVSNSPLLTTLNAARNSLTSLKTNCPVLEYLDASDNSLPTIDVSKNVGMLGLNLKNNNLSSIDVSVNTALNRLRLSGNNLNYVDISNNPDIDQLELDNILVKTAMNYTLGSGSTTFDLSGLKFLGTYNTIENTSNYTFAAASSTLTVSNLNGTAGYAQISQLEGAPLVNGEVLGNQDYKLQLSGYVLTLNSNGGAEDLGTLVCLPASTAGTSCTITLPTGTPTRSGYNLLGWAESASATTATYAEGATVTLSGSKTLYAVWEEISYYTYRLTFDANGGSGVPGDLTYGPTTDWSHEFVIPEGTPTREGYSFIGYQKSSTTSGYYFAGDSVIAFSDAPTITLYAKWEELTKYTLSYDLNGATGSIASQTCTVASGATNCTLSISAAVPARSGYVFLGWAESNSAISAGYSAGGSISLSANKTLYAVWAPVYTLSFDVNGGIGTVVAQTCNPTTTNGVCAVTIPTTTPERDEYEFFGWARSASAVAADYKGGNIFTFTAGTYNVTLYAVWADGTITWVQGQEREEGSEEDAILIINYPVSDFEDLLINGETVDPENYTVEDDGEGNTKITINAEYLDDLGEGEYTVKVVYDNGTEADTSMTVTKKNEDDGSDDEDGLAVPDTGSSTGKDGNGAMMMLYALPVVGITIAAGACYGRMRKAHRKFDC